MIIQIRRNSQSETSAKTMRDVVNIISLQPARVSGDQNVTSPLCYVIVRLARHLDTVSQRLNHVVRSDAN